MTKSISKLLEKARGEPITVSLLLTRRCNNKCDHCMYSCSPTVSPRFMSYSVLRGACNWCDTLREYGISSEINVIGGEPTFFMKKFDDAINILYMNHSVTMFMTTNGWWLARHSSTRKFLEAVARPVDAGVLKIRVSNSEFHDAWWTGRSPKELMFRYTFDYEYGDFGDCYIPDPVDENDPWIFLDRKLESVGVNCVGRAYDTGVGWADQGVKDSCLLSSESISLLPSGKTFDGCSFGGDLPFGSYRDNPLVILLLNMHFKHNVRESKTACMDCIELARSWSKTSDFRKAKQEITEFVEEIE